MTYIIDNQMHKRKINELLIYTARNKAQIYYLKN